MRRWNLPLLAGLALLIILMAAIILPTFLDTERATTTHLNFDTAQGEQIRAPLSPGRLGYILGTDIAGRDLFLRLIMGARLTLITALLVLGARVAVGIPLGLIAGWRGGWLARMFSALGTGFGAMPSLILLLILMAGAEPIRIGYSIKFMLVLGVIGLPRLIEHVRRVTTHVRQMPHVEAAISLGASPSRILRRHIWPIMRGDLLVTLASELAWVLIMIAHLSLFNFPTLAGRMGWQVSDRRFVSIEVQPEWATMLAVNLEWIRTYWWIPVFPAMALGLAVACFHLLAEGLRLRNVPRQ